MQIKTWNHENYQKKKKLFKHMTQRFNYRSQSFFFFWNNIGYLKLNVYVNMYVLDPKIKPDIVLFKILIVDKSFFINIK